MKTIKVLLNRLILLIFICTVTSGTYLLLAAVRSKPVDWHDFYLALMAGGILWIFNVIFGKIKDWPFKES
jgi:hypothetical protein